MAKLQATTIEGKELNDFVIESDMTKASCRYKKWNNGMTEVWGKLLYPMPLFNESTGSGSTIQANLFKTNFSIPTGLFVSAPDYIFTSASRGTGYYPMGTWVNTRNTSSIGIVVWSSISANITDLSIEVYAIGRWK